jgi:hypothetical protein
MDGQCSRLTFMTLHLAARDGQCSCCQTMTNYRHIKLEELTERMGTSYHQTIGAAASFKSAPANLRVMLRAVSPSLYLRSAPANLRVILRAASPSLYLRGYAAIDYALDLQGLVVGIPCPHSVRAWLQRERSQEEVRAA